jgi:hypothetical protein
MEKKGMEERKEGRKEGRTCEGKIYKMGQLDKNIVV